MHAHPHHGSNTPYLTGYHRGPWRRGASLRRPAGRVGGERAAREGSAPGMGATASAAAGVSGTGSPRTAAADMPQGTAAGPARPVIVGSLTIAGRTRNVAEAR